MTIRLRGNLGGFIGSEMGKSGGRATDNLKEKSVQGRVVVPVLSPPVLREGVKRVGVSPQPNSVAQSHKSESFSRRIAKGGKWLSG
ncbi:hypothetical protein RRG08_006531 [Elysia crispata]|uniref:Uncharacterized protein n=1 Tax=Elysia crispata TaxID=231223 RepID=A0AAE1AB86_9GAST|nr:hypothetical protein RRG08_006531 [Elysia crispata]